MLKTLTLVLTIFCLSFLNLHSALHFRPLTANPLEPRIGGLFQTNADRLRLDIGTSLDMINFNKNSLSPVWLGFDFMTYTRLQHEGKFKFPVETSDYFFGINLSGSLAGLLGGLDYRLRIAHISSHLVDGYVDENKDFLQEPFVYSKEFLNLVFAKKFNFGANYLLEYNNEVRSFIRTYAGGEYTFSKIPDNLNELNWQIGIDGEFIFHQRFSIVGGIDLQTRGHNGLNGETTKTPLATATQIGILHRTYNHTGLLFSVYHYSGRSMHGMFFDKLENYFAVGFQLIFY